MALATMKVGDILYSSDSIPDRFHDGRPVRIENCAGSTMEVVLHQGEHFALNNRTLFAHRCVLWPRCCR